ncbi:MAG TPA: rhodanese-like domain-containing protein [Gammaproteobacteria bacterium]|nr:rhodanese-like domain-containing protein [Gammaproteobacteria bacterium]
MAKSKLQHISAKQAFDLIKKEPATAFIDVRSDMEFLFIGHPVGAVNIPWIDEPDFVINPDFEREVRRLILGGVIETSEHRSVHVILICRSGNRSAEAGELLIEHGFRHVYNIEQGFEGGLDDHHHRSTLGGWRYEGLPWEQC